MPRFFDYAVMPPLARKRAMAPWQYDAFHAFAMPAAHACLLMLSFFCCRYHAI